MIIGSEVETQPAFETETVYVPAAETVIAGVNDPSDQVFPDE